MECSLHRKPWTTRRPRIEPVRTRAELRLLHRELSSGLAQVRRESRHALRTDDGLVAAAYAPCEVHTAIRDTPVHLVEETDYPFRSSVRFTVNPAAPLAFPFLVRIPAWAAGTRIKVNGSQQPVPEPGSSRGSSAPGSQAIVSTRVPLKPRVSRWFNDSVAVERGPLVFSYGIGEDWVKLRDRGMTADWQVYPTTQWNYALALDSASPEKDIGITEGKITHRPFSRKRPPVTLNVQARKLPGWRSEAGVADPVPQSPVTSDQPEETIELIPYAAAKLRITAFPQLS